MKNLFATAVAVASLAEFGASSDITDATNASNAIKALTDMLQVEPPTGKAPEFFNPLKELKKEVPGIGIIAKVFKIAKPSDTAKILKALDGIST